MERSEIEEMQERIWGIEAFLEEFIPALIAASSGRAQLEELLDGMADIETRPEDGEPHWIAGLAEKMLLRLRSG